MPPRLERSHLRLFFCWRKDRREMIKRVAPHCASQWDIGRYCAILTRRTKDKLWPVHLSCPSIVAWSSLSRAQILSRTPPVSKEFYFSASSIQFRSGLKYSAGQIPEPWCPRHPPSSEKSSETFRAKLYHRCPSYGWRWLSYSWSVSIVRPIRQPGASTAGPSLERKRGYSTKT